MLKNTVKILLCLVLVLSLTSICLAIDTKSVAVSASVPAENALSVTVSRIVGATWTPATSIDFANLVFDPVNSIFTADSYYAVDIGTNSNALDWAVTHTRSSVVNGAESLDSNINVTFTKETGITSTQLAKLSYLNSDNQAFTKAQLADGWLRAYYGIATGDPLNDAPGASPITLVKPSGTYSGTVTFTLTP